MADAMIAEEPRLRTSAHSGSPARAAASATLPDGSTVELPQSAVGKNYLIIGSDARPGETASRSDVIVLAHIPEDKSAVQLIHFPRGLYVPIPGRSKDKINAAYAYGGAPLLVSTMQNLLGVKIDHAGRLEPADAHVVGQDAGEVVEQLAPGERPLQDLAVEVLDAPVVLLQVEGGHEWHEPVISAALISEGAWR